MEHNKQKHPMIIHNGKLVHVNNSMGQPIHHTHEGVKNFHDWFGDSTNTDEHGRPRVMYHGTDADFHSFKHGVAWVSDTPHLANDYAEFRHAQSTGWQHKGKEPSTPHVIPVYVKSQNTFDADKLPHGSNKLANLFGELKSQSNKSVDKELKSNLDTMKAHASEEGSGPYYGKKDFWHQSDSYFGTAGAKVLQDSFRVAGFDSISHTEGGHKTIGVLDSNNIKSAVGNSGKFSKATDKITEDTAPVVSVAAGAIDTSEPVVHKDAQKKIVRRNRLKTFKEFCEETK